MWICEAQRECGVAFEEGEGGCSNSVVAVFFPQVPARLSDGKDADWAALGSQGLIRAES
jgi:hypothetical protein